LFLSLVLLTSFRFTAGTKPVFHLIHPGDQRIWEPGINNQPAPHPEQRERHELPRITTPQNQPSRPVLVDPIRNRTARILVFP
jgi:hypothetical protein